MKQNTRHRAIISLIQQQGFVDTDALVEQFAVSPQTIRRDLNELANADLIRRHHGGATLPSSSENTAYSDRKVQHLKEKEAIARALAKHIPDGASLFIDIGTTPEAVAKALLEKHIGLQIVTNNLNVAAMLMHKTDFNLILAGGEVRSKDGGIVGETTVDLIRQFNLDFAILGISGISDGGDLYDFDYHEVRVKRAIIENSRRVLLAVDNSKFGRNAMVRLGMISDISLLISDSAPPASILDLARQHDVEIEIVAV